MAKDRCTQINKTQLRIGTRHELEHTKSRKVARRIACDHLLESPRYYTYLNKMEKQMARDKNSK